MRAFIASFLAVAVATAWANVETRQGSHKGEQKGRDEAAAAWIHQMAGPGRVRHSDGPLAKVPALDTVAGIKALQVTNGPLHGAFVVAPYGYVNWYFAASALIHFTDDIPDEAAAFVDAYLRHLEQTARSSTMSRITGTKMEVFRAGKAPTAMTPTPRCSWPWRPNSD